MVIAIWIIAVCEFVRILQNTIQLTAVVRDRKSRENAYAEFVKSLKDSDREFVRKLLEEYERQEGEA